MNRVLLYRLKATNQSLPPTSLLDFNDDQMADIKTYLLKPVPLNDELGARIGFCALWHITHAIKPFSGWWFLCFVCG